MAGRAGRRGIDDEGIVVSRVNPHLIPHSILMKIVYGKPEPIESQFNSCYATLINLYDQLGEKLVEVYPKSFHSYQADKHSQKKAAELIQRKLALLRELGHTSAEGITDKGKFASWMYGYELILSELLEEGALEYVDDVGLAVLLAALTYEPRRNQSEPDLPKDLVTIAKRADRAHDRIRQMEAKFKVFPPTRPPAFHLALAVKAWTQGAPFSDMGRFTDVDEGEIIRHLRMVIQLLRQIQHAPLVSDRLRQTATSARKKINRDWVDAEKQLKNM
jgi:ATP-dependent RNA helicase DOB1